MGDGARKGFDGIGLDGTKKNPAPKKKKETAKKDYGIVEKWVRMTKDGNNPPPSLFVCIIDGHNVLFLCVTFCVF